MSDDEWDESSSEEVYVQSAKDRFIKRITSLHQKVVPFEPVSKTDETPEEEFIEKPSKSADQLLSEYFCKFCGFKGICPKNGTPSECACGGLLNNDFQVWVENKALSSLFGFPSLFTEKPLEQYVNQEPSEMSWQQLTNALSPQLVFDDEKPTMEDIEVDEKSVDSDGEYEIVPDTCECPDDISELKERLACLEENHNSLIAEREYLIQQLQACEDRIEELHEEQADVMEELEEQCAAGENAIAEELVSCLDEFSQAVQVLLDNSEYYDISDLIRSYTKDGNTPGTIKKEIILDAKLHKKRVLLGDTKKKYIPKNEDGLPRLHDSYITDSYEF